MFTQKYLQKTLNTLSSLLLVSMAALLPLSLSQAAAKSVATGTQWVVDKTTTLDELVIHLGGLIQAPKGFELSLTVDGVGLPISPGSYQGDIVLTPTKEYLVDFSFLMSSTQYQPYHFRIGLLINDGQYQAEQSVTAAVGKAKFDNETAQGIDIVSKEENFNGVVVTGNSNYTINGIKVDMTGNGANDFAGVGAAIMSSGNALLTINNADIKTKGAARTALFIGGNSTMIVNDSTIETFSGTLPEDYKFSIEPGKMLEVPYGLGLSGNVRATNLVDKGTVYYNNSHIISHGWGVLSSDGDGPTRMYVNKSVIDTIGSGYGAYANGDSHDYFSASTLNVPDVGLVVGGNGWATFTDGSIINSEKLGVMLHQGTGGSLITLEKKSKINSKNTAIQVKGRGADILVDDAELFAGNGILIQSMENDDPIMRDIMANAALPMPAQDVGDGIIPGASSGGFSPDVNVTFKNTKLAGDVVHAMTAVGNMKVNLQHATLNGAMTTAESYPASGQEPTRETFRTVGEVVNTYGTSVNLGKLKVFLDWDSSWMVSKTSYLNALVIAQGATVEAVKGASLSMTVNGVLTPIEAGSYSGSIVIRVASRH